MAVEIVYETHATSTHNEAGIASGWLPGELSTTGRQQARELGTRRRDTGIAVVFCSDLRRSEETAEIAFGGTGVPIRTDARLRECDYGALNGHPVDEVAAERPHRIDTPFPGGQSYREVVMQTGLFLTDLLATWDDQRVLLIAHTANLWALDHLLNGAALEDLVAAPFDWQDGWTYHLPTGWEGRMGP